MHIICPDCTTSYAINLATLGAAGRTVRCSRCKEVWLARPEDAVDMTAPVPAMAEAGAADAGADAAAEWEAMAQEDEAQETPVVDSPSISGDGSSSEIDWPSDAQHDALEAWRPPRQPWYSRLLRPPVLFRASGKPLVSLPLACAAMGALVLALVIWRVDVVRLLPQTATFYRMGGLEVNLRGLLFK